MRTLQRLLSPSFGSFSKLIKPTSSEAVTKDKLADKEPLVSASEAVTNDSPASSAPLSEAVIQDTLQDENSSETVVPSSLFIPGNLGQTVTPFVIPHYKLSQLDPTLMESNLLARNYTDVKPLQEIVTAGLELESLEEKLEVAGADLKRLRELFKQQKEANDPEATKTQEEIIKSRPVEKAMTAKKHLIEESFVMEYLNLPNSLHSETPTGKASKVIHSRELDIAVEASHADLCRDQLTFTDYGVYMEGDLALMELDLTGQANSFLNSLGFEMVSAPDITRSSILEGCNPGCDLVTSGATDVALPMAGTGDFGDHGSAKGAHLVGSASLYPFVGQLSKNIVVNGPMPIRQFSIGRKYLPVAVKNPAASLFDVAQTTCAEVFTASKDGHQMEVEFDGLVTAMRDFYDGLEVPYKMQLLPAAKLLPSQSKSVVVTVPTVKWRQQEVVVGQVALYDDFISKRLMLMNDSGRPLHIAAGTLVDVTKMIGCSVEHKGK